MSYSVIDGLVESVGKYVINKLPALKSVAWHAGRFREFFLHTHRFLNVE